jgi:hypothetical protein
MSEPGGVSYGVSYGYANDEGFCGVPGHSIPDLFAGIESRIVDKYLDKTFRTVQVSKQSYKSYHPITRQ